MTEKIVTLGGRQHELEVDHEGTKVRAGAHEIEIVAMNPREAEIRVEGRLYAVPFVLEGTQISFAFDGEIYVADVSDKGARSRARHRDHSMSAPMPGVVLKILVQPGAAVEKNAPLLILEAMKMEHQIHAPYGGTVKAVNCKEGELVQPGVELVELEKTPE